MAKDRKPEPPKPKPKICPTCDQSLTDNHECQAEDIRKGWWPL